MGSPTHGLKLPIHGRWNDLGNIYVTVGCLPVSPGGMISLQTVVTVPKMVTQNLRIQFSKINYDIQIYS